MLVPSPFLTASLVRACLKLPVSNGQTVSGRMRILYYNFVRISAHGIRSRNSVFLFRYYAIISCASAHMESIVDTMTFFGVNIITYFQRQGQFPSLCVLICGGNHGRNDMVRISGRLRKCGVTRFPGTSFPAAAYNKAKYHRMIGYILCTLLCLSYCCLPFWA